VIELLQDEVVLIKLTNYQYVKITVEDALKKFKFWTKTPLTYPILKKKLKDPFIHLQLNHIIAI
jgi:ribosomal protein L11